MCQPNGGNVGIGTTTPTASLHLPAGTAAAHTAPLKLTAGTNLTTPEAGAIEFDGNFLYYTDSSNARHLISSGGGSGTVDTGAVNQLAYYSAAGTAVTGLTSAASSVLITNASSQPSWAAISADTFTQYALLAGRTGGQTIFGGTAASNNLTLNSTSNATRGNVLIAANGGSVGIGTTSPGYPIDAEFNTATDMIINFQNNSATTGAYLNISSSGSSYSGFEFQTPSQNWGMVQDGSTNFSIEDLTHGNKVPLAIEANAPSNSLYVKSSGNVGIGTTSPQSKLDVWGALDISGTPIALNNLSDASATDEAAGHANLMLGQSAGAAMTIGTAVQNVGIGRDALLADTTGSQNTGVGAWALQNNTTGNGNTGVGSLSLGGNTTGGNNTGIGYETLYYDTTGSNNVAIGSLAGLGVNGITTAANSVLLGVSAGQGLTTGNGNVLVGESAGSGITTGGNNIIIGYNQQAIVVGASNTLNIGGGISPPVLPGQSICAAGSVGNRINGAVPRVRFASGKTAAAIPLR